MLGGSLRGAEVMSPVFSACSQAFCMSCYITSELEDTKTKSIRTRPNVISTALHIKR